jgi:2-(1,2-epoxy-1,2-dihydrophenyl)acetyl-CoA isomerase
VTELEHEAGADGVTTVRINRPGRMNAYTSALCQQLLVAVEEFARDDDQRALILTGSGRAFCAGGDVRSRAQEDRRLGHAMVMRENMHRVVLALHQLDKPTIAAINGAAVAGGLALACMCDFRVAARSARLGDTSVRLGLLPDEGGTWIFPRLMGRSAARRMVLCSEIYPADRARELGLVDDAAHDAELMDHARALASTLAATAPLSLRLANRMLGHAPEQTLAQALAEAELAVMITNSSRDAREGVAAFVEKRIPSFEGR